MNWPSNRNWQTKVLDTRKATQLNLLCQKRVQGLVIVTMIVTTKPRTANQRPDQPWLAKGHKSDGSNVLSLAQVTFQQWKGAAHTWGRYHGDRRPSSDDSFHSPTVSPPSALDILSIMKCYHCQRTCSHTSPHRPPTMVTLFDTRFVE